MNGACLKAKEYCLYFRVVYVVSEEKVALTVHETVIVDIDVEGVVGVEFAGA